MSKEYDVAIVSGYFNPLHLGHLKMIQEASKLADEVIVIVNNDTQQELKKGKIIMDQDERLAIVEALEIVDGVILSKDDDATVCKTLDFLGSIKSDEKMVFCNGGDRNSEKEVPEAAVCKEYNIDMKFDTGGDYKTNSSTNINKIRGEE